jgi:predicted transcriptional regulator
MGSAKEEVRKMLDKIPDNASFEDIQYHIYVREKVESGLRCVEEGRVVSQEEVEHRMRKWIAE